MNNPFPSAMVSDDVAIGPHHAVAACLIGIGVPIMLAYVYGVVPISLCRGGGCGVSRGKGNGVRIDFDEDDGPITGNEETHAPSGSHSIIYILLTTLVEKSIVSHSGLSLCSPLSSPFLSSLSFLFLSLFLCCCVRETEREVKRETSFYITLSHTQLG